VVGGLELALPVPATVLMVPPSTNFRIRLFSVQNREYQDRLLALDVPPDKVTITGNMKYDGIDTSETPDREPVLRELRIAGDSRVLVAGSTHGGEEEILLGLFKTLMEDHPDLRLILAPRHIERVEEIEKACLRRTSSRNWRPTDCR